MADAVEALQKRVTTLGAIVATLVGLNSALTTCSTDTTNRYAAFRTAVSGEENFWKDRFNEYADDVAITDENQRHGKLMALAALSQHPVPKFEEYWLGPGVSGPKEAAEEQLKNLRQSLIAALSNDRDKQVAELVRQSVHFEKTEQGTKPDDGTTTSAPGTQPVQTADQAPSLETQVVGIGPAEGWDIDVFWCAADTDAGNVANYNYAKRVANGLGSVATKQHPVGPGVMLGRVQLRPLPQLVQGRGDYPVRGSGNTLLIGADSGEQEAGTALLKVLTKSNFDFAPRQTMDGSKYYMSAFVCGAPPPATTATVSTAPSGSAPAAAQGGANGSAVRPTRVGAGPRGVGKLRS
jgi:hypothetical protein